MFIQTKDLIKTYKSRNVVDKVSVRVEEGEIVGLLGPNGAGKTTTFYMIVGVEKPTSGSIYIGDVDVTRMPMYKRSAHGIGYLPQEASIFRNLTVKDNILAMLETTNLSKAEQKDTMESLLEEFHITHVRERLGIQLSGGERRRVEIARAIALNPKFILLDEPFAGVDPIAVADIQSIIRHLKDRGIGVLITDHNVRETLGIVDKAYILNSGMILLEGTADEVATSDVARKFYLGDDFRM